MIDMISVEGGTFLLGKVTPIELSDFNIGKYPVTQAQWREVMGSNPSWFKNCDDCPVEDVSWNDIQDFLKKLNGLTGKTYRLPTEAEWEYAAKGGKLSKGYKYAGSNDLNEVGWYWKNSDGKTHPVGSKAPNELGIYDMSGNVWEWCNDWYGDYPKEAEDNYSGPQTGEYKVLRGGSWNNDDVSCRSAVRLRSYPDLWYDFGGFRVSRHL